MDLLEYQAKSLFRQMAIPILPSQRIDNLADLKGLKIPYPVVLKSQVRAGGRGRAGGIKFVENTIDAVAAAQTIFNLPIEDEYPQVLLAEAKYNADQELYLAVLLDPVARRPVLLGSRQGGMDVEGSIEQMQQVAVDQEFSPFYARRLTLKMGLQGDLIQSVSTIVEKMYRLFVEKDLDLVEINPLGISPRGEVMALDGKVTANDDALGRHPDLAALSEKRQSSGLPRERR
ncbi:MAG: acetate--CoA ligase family protein, partial [Microcoleus sp. C1-bin4]|nr:acetate--CoA ligase family protein [Microcoleus sp. C1-bin4]